MSDGVVAGRLEVPVESDTKGFGDRLRAALEKETRNIAAKIGVELDEDGLRKKLEATVEKAARGVEAKIDVTANTAKAKAQIERLGKDQKVNVTVENLSDDVKRQSLLARIFAKRNPIEFPVRTNRKGFFADLAARKVEAAAYMKKHPVEIPFAGGKNFRSAVMPLFYLAIASVIQPAIATLVGGIGGLLPMVANLAMSLKTLAVGGPLITGLLGGFMAVQTALQQITLDGKNAVPGLNKVRKEYESLVKSLTSDDQNQKVAIAFWDKLLGKLDPITKRVIPLWNKGMVSFAGTSGTIAANLADWMATPLFNGQFKRLLGSGDTLLGGFGVALVGIAKGFLNISDAASMVVGGKDSLVTRFNRALKGIGDWGAGLAAPGKKATKFANELSYAADKASQLWRMVKDLGSGIAGIFKAGRDSGDSLLGSLEGALDKWGKYVNSGEGQKAIKDWFKGVEPIVREAGSLIGDIGAAILRLANDPNTATMLKKIRTDVVPTLEKFLSTLGKTLGPEVIDFFTNVLSVLSEMSEAGGPLAKGLGHINDALSKFSDWLRDNPDMAQKLGVILGGLLAFRALSFAVNASGILTLLNGLSAVTKGGGLGQLSGLAIVLGVFSGALKDLPVPLQGAAAAIGTFIALRSSLPAIQGIVKGLSSAFDGVRLQAMYAADSYTRSVGKFKTAGSGGFSAAAKAVGTTAGQGLRGALSGLGASIGMGAATGGPIGAAIGVVTGLVGIWATAHANAKQKAMEYKGAVDEIKASLDAETGALTESTRATVVKQLQDNGTADAAQKLGLNLMDVTDAALGLAPAQERINRALKASVTSALKANGTYGRMQEALAGTGITMDDFAEAALKGDSGMSALQQRIEAMPGLTDRQKDSLLGALDVTERATGAQKDLASKLGASAHAVADATAKQKQNNAMMATAQRQVEGVIGKLRALPVGKTTTVKALTADAKAKLEALGYKVKTMPDGSVVITATASAAKAEAALNRAARDRWTTIHANYKAAQANQADGGIMHFSKFAKGGFFDGLRNKVQSFANGTENHIAQIAKAGTWRVWAEDETGGEAYIPLARSKRGRSMAILAEVADRFGMMLAPKVGAIAKALGAQQGSMAGIAAFAHGAINTASGLTAATGGGITFEYGAIQITNPVAEPASKSVASTLRGLGEFGLFGGEGD